MDILLIYLIKSALFLSVSVALFMLLMCYETFHRFNRCLLLFVLATSMILPAVNFAVDSPMSRFTQIIEMLVNGGYEYGDANNFSAFAEYTMSGVSVVNDETASFVESTAFGVVESVAILYFVVAFIMLLRLIYMYVQVTLILQKGQRHNSLLYVPFSTRLKVHSDDYKPFSWFGWISISEKDIADGGHEILTHEYAHVKNRHSWDILFIDLLIIVQWFNPMVWVAKRMIKDIHEYEADSAVLAAGVDAKQYQLLIIKKAVGARLYSIANSFNHSLTKKRITMMCKEKSSLWSCTKALYILPLAVVAACTFSSPKSDEPSAKVNENVADVETFVEKTEMQSSVSKNEKTEEAVKLTIHDGNSENLSEVSSLERNAQFVGGAKAMMSYIAQNTHYPKECIADSIQGRTYINFIVSKDGSVKDAEVIRSSGNKLLDDEALRVVNSMPAFTPGVDKEGNVVDIRMVLPVVFKLQ